MVLLVQAVILYIAFKPGDSTMEDDKAPIDKRVEKHLRKQGEIKKSTNTGNGVTDNKSILQADHFVEQLRKAMELQLGKERIGALAELLRKAGEMKDQKLLEMLLPLLVASGNPEDVWLSLEGLYLALDSSMLAPLDRTMQAMHTPQYHTFLEGNIASSKTTEVQQVHMVHQIQRMAAENSYVRPRLLSSLGYTALISPNKQVRAETLNALEKVGDSSIVHALKEQKAKETDEGLKQRIDQVIAQISNRH